MELRQQFEILATDARGTVEAIRKFDGFGPHIQPQAEEVYGAMCYAAINGDQTNWPTESWQTLMLVGPNGFARRWTRL